MPDHLDLSAESIKGILAYIKSETKAPTAEPLSGQTGFIRSTRRF